MLMYTCTKDQAACSSPGVHSGDPANTRQQTKNLFVGHKPRRHQKWPVLCGTENVCMIGSLSPILVADSMFFPTCQVRVQILTNVQLLLLLLLLLLARRDCGHEWARVASLGCSGPRLDPNPISPAPKAWATPGPEDRECQLKC